MLYSYNECVKKTPILNTSYVYDNLVVQTRMAILSKRRLILLTKLLHEQCIHHTQINLNPNKQLIRFGSKLYRQIVGIPMGTNCAPLVADLFLFCYERDFMLSQTDIIEAFNSCSRYLDDLLNIDNPYFEQMVGQIYPAGPQLNKANSSDTEASFLELTLSITNGIVSSKIYDKRDILILK